MPRVAKAAAMVVVLALAGGQLAHLLAPDPEVGHWKSVPARDRYMAAYAEVLATLPPPDQVRDVATSFGTVRVTMWRGGAAGRPVVLLPGHSSGAPMWAENLPSWIGRRTVYALDPIGDAGCSAQSTPMTSPSDQATWIAEAVRALRIAPVHVVGHSFGGANAARFAVEHPDLVATLTLEEPVIVIRPLPAAIYLWSSLLLLPTPQAWKDHALARIGGTSVQQVRQRTPMSVMIDAAASGYATALPTPTTLSDQQWQSLRMPVRVDIGGASTLAGGQAAADRIHRLLPDATVRVWPGATHSLPMDEHDELGPILEDFWKRY